MEMIEAHPDKPWDWYNISLNPNITMEIIERNINKIDLNCLSRNKFGWKSDDTIRYYKQRTLEIKEELITLTWHPDRFIKWCLDVKELKEIEETFGK